MIARMPFYEEIYGMNTRTHTPRLHTIAVCLNAYRVLTVRIMVLRNDIMIIIQEPLQWLFGFPGPGLGGTIHPNSNRRGNSCAGPI